MGGLTSLQQLQKAQCGTLLRFFPASESESFCASAAARRLPTSSTVTSYKLTPHQSITKHLSYLLHAALIARLSGNMMTPDLQSAALMSNSLVHRGWELSEQKHQRSGHTISGNTRGPIRSNLKRLRAGRASLSSVVDLGQVAFWALVVTSAVFLPYSLAIVSGYESAIQTVSSGEAESFLWSDFKPLKRVSCCALDKAADAGQHIMDHLPLWQLHAANAVLYLCATPIQFLPSVRKRSLPLHRASGYLFLSTGTVLAFSGLIMAPLSEFPGFVPPSVVLAVIWVLFGGVAMWKIKKKRVQEHREWMVRAAAAGYSVILTRPLVVAVHLVSGLSHRAAGQSATWLSLLIMVAGTEIYIQSRHRLDSSV